MTDLPHRKVSGDSGFIVSDWLLLVSTMIPLRCARIIYCVMYFAILVQTTSLMWLHSISLFRMLIVAIRIDSPPVPIASTLEEDSRYPDEVISGIEVKGKRLYLFPPWLPIPQWTISNLFSHLEISRRNNHLPDDIEAFASHSLGKAFASHHHHLITDPSLNHGTAKCINTVNNVST